MKPVMEENCFIIPSPVIPNFTQCSVLCLGSKKPMKRHISTDLEILFLVDNVGEKLDVVLMFFLF